MVYKVDGSGAASSGKGDVQDQKLTGSPEEEGTGVSSPQAFLH